MLVSTRILSLNGAGAYVEGVCVSNGYAQGGGVNISGSWMANATDFFGNPRANNRRYCDIGFHQTGSDSLLFFVQ